MRQKKAKEQLIAIITLCSVFIFFIYLKMNPEINSTSESAKVESSTFLNSEKVEINNIIEENVAQMGFDNNAVEDNKSVINKEDLQSSESIIEYTESELKRAKSYLKRDWKPDHTINLAAWDYVSKNSMLQDKKTDLDIEENQVVNAIK